MSRLSVRLWPGSAGCMCFSLPTAGTAVDDHDAGAVASAELVVVAPLGVLLVDHLAGRPAPRPLRLRRLDQIAEDVRRLIAVAVETHMPDLDLELGMLEAADAEAGNLRQGEILGQQDRRVARRGLVAVEGGREVGGRPAENAGGVLNAGVDHTRPAPVELQVVTRMFSTSSAALTIVDQAARRLDRQLAQAIVVRQLQ